MKIRNFFTRLARKDPIIHFIILGIIIFGYFIFFKPSFNESDTEINVTKEDLLLFLQYDNKVYSPEFAKIALANMSQTAIKNLIDEYIKEEVLYREALSMGLDKDDYIIKRRLVQKMQFMTEGVMEATSKVSSKEIENYFKQHQADYYIQPSVTFTHVFFSNETHGKKLALALAKRQLKVLNNNKVPFADAPKYGDRFLYYVNYVDRTKDFIDSHFATTMSNKLFQLKPSHHWYGPLKSPYGYHLVYVSKHTLGRKAKLSEVIDKVTYDLQLQKNSQETDKIINDIIKTYKVKVEIPALSGDSKLTANHH